MIDPTEQERIALLGGGRLAGEYLDSLGVTDLARLDDASWYQFLRCVVGGYQETLRQIQQASQGLPYDEPPPF